MSAVRTLKYQSIKHLLFKRSEYSHKGDNGHALVIGGDHGFGGAALMAAEACARSGAGLVSVATRPEHSNAFLARRPELMVTGIKHSSEISRLLDNATVVIAGPGLGQSSWSMDCLKATLGSGKPVVLDADALNLISHDLFNTPLPRLSIITPHPGEAARLLGISVTQVQEDREQACLALQEKYADVAILKGSGTLIACDDNGRKQLEKCCHGNPGMGSGGMGDVLSGVIGGLLCQGFSLNDSARLGVCIHSLGADMAAAAQGERGLLATDLLPHIHKLVNNS